MLYGAKEVEATQAFFIPAKTERSQDVRQPLQLVIRHVGEYVRLSDDRNRDRIRLSIQAKYLAPLLNAPADPLQEPRIASLAVLPHLRPIAAFRDFGSMLFLIAARTLPCRPGVLLDYIDALQFPALHLVVIN